MKERRVKKTLHSENLVVSPDEVDNCKESNNSEDNSEARSFWFLSACVVCSWSFSFSWWFSPVVSPSAGVVTLSDWSGFVGYVTSGYVGFVTGVSFVATWSCYVTSFVTDGLLNEWVVPELMCWVSAILKNIPWPIS